jgi:hypothetical protein
MRASRVMRFSASATGTRNLKSLALSVFFKHPDLDMKDYEILTRATAYLLSIDAKDKVEQMERSKKGPYDHLEAAEEWRDNREYKQVFGRSRASGGVAQRKMLDMSWLEFVPREVRPRVHIVCSSHVLAPYLWNDYYPQDWLQIVRPEHCKFALDVFDPADPKKSLAHFPLVSQPYHHPEGRDIALIHFRDELKCLDTLWELGVQTHFLRDLDKLYNKGEAMQFDGYVVEEPDKLENTNYNPEDEEDPMFSDDEIEEDKRIFLPYRENGVLTFHTEDRFFATTPKPLPQGLCGAPVTDTDGDLCGTVEGIVPIDHKNKNLAGSAAFIPSFVMKVFLDFVERSLVEKMMPEELFQMVVTAKKTNSVGGGFFRKDKDGNYTKPTNWEQEYDRAMANLKKRYTPEEVEKILSTIEDQRDDVQQIFDKEGGDMDEIIESVRIKTEQIKALVQDQVLKSRKEREDDAVPAEKDATA